MSVYWQADFFITLKKYKGSHVRLAFCISGNTSTSCDANVTIETNCFYSDFSKQTCQIHICYSFLRHFFLVPLQNKLNVSI